MSVTQIYDAKTFRPRDGLGYLIGRVRKALLDEIERELAPLDVSAAQWIVIVLVADGSAVTLADLCKSMSYDPGAMTRLIDRVESKGFVRRVRMEGDRRCVHLELTGEGEVLYPKIREVLAEVYNRMLRGFTQSEVEQLKGFLNRILANA
jgi:DNA-binding MarR family transcriptional regulator